VESCDDGQRVALTRHLVWHIQDAAIVCKHCERDLKPAAQPCAGVPERTGFRRYGALIVMIVLVGLAVHFLNGHLAFSEWARKRESWKTRCEQYRTVPLSHNTKAKTCNDGLNGPRHRSSRERLRPWNRGRSLRRRSRCRRSLLRHRATGGVGRASISVV
jgi:hypothetical protein